MPFTPLRARDASRQPDYAYDDITYDDAAFSRLLIFTHAAVRRDAERHFER